MSVPKIAIAARGPSLLAKAGICVSTVSIVCGCEGGLSDMSAADQIGATILVGDMIPFPAEIVSSRMVFHRRGRLTVLTVFKGRPNLDEPGAEPSAGDARSHTSNAKCPLKRLVILASFCQTNYY
jgi:hypothetical protein